ncbi:hypothetical protein C471_07711 [Halorubrum saccharovorum DSM 1137]|uniref:Uncharacterized protein n=1 Tax=Halorubrum saccharovorum DSM 1137 TaxID=1227484 RepID=M0E126_9EURY|nr:hypothetical protein [Halorubrum saccharovorum]ELZ40652.1 hypothetical protein C471_07711 [Halorubrum saccharovorum DSM 1137]
MKHKDTRLDSDALLVLDALSRQDDRRLTTSEAKTVTGITDNDYVRRRFQKLEAADLVTLDKDDTAPTPIPPTRATLTDSGVEKAESWDLNPKSNDIRSAEERLLRVERRLDDLDTRLDTIEDAATSESDRMPDLEEARRLVATLSNHAVEDMDADLGKHYPVDV